MECSATPSLPLPTAASIEKTLELPLPTNSLVELQEQPSHLTDQGPVGAVVALKEDYTEVHALMAEKLPKFVILQSNYNNIYLHLNDAIDGMPNALQFSGDYSFNLDTRFEVVPATTLGGHFHIRSMYNNKYWSRMPDTNWITAGDTEPVEDTSKWSCTLFQPIFVNAGDNSTVRFRHVNTGYYVCLCRVDPPRNGCLYLGGPGTNKDQCDVCTIIDWQSIVVFPNRIVIKGNNNKYLRSWKDGFMYFNHEKLGNPELEYEVTPSRNGGVRLKSIFYDTYWRDEDSSMWVLADGRHPTIHYTNTVFLPVKLGNNVIAFRCLRNNLYCRRLTAQGQVNTVASLSTNIDNEARLVIEEPILSRKIEDVNFRLTDAKISRDNVLVLINKEVINRTHETDTVVFDLKYTDSRTSTWNAGVSLTLGTKITMSSSVPFVMEGSVEFSSEFTGSYQWGESIERKIETGSLYTVRVPPMSRVKATLMATQGSCNVPFSYTQHDVLLNGMVKVYEKDDGWYTGLNSFNYKYEAVQFPLDQPN